jgi:hypothetical protein
VRRRLLGWKPYPDPVLPPCVLCGSERRETVARRVAFEMRYRTALCLDCGLVYLCPRPSEEAFADFYARLYPRLYGTTRADDAPTARGAGVVAFLAERLDLGSHTGLFDVGCGRGGLLRAAAAAPETGGLALAGCDPGWPDPDGALLHEGGREIRIHRRPVEELAEELEGSTILVLYDVLEHVLDPLALLRSLHARAPAGSALFVSTSCLEHWRDVPPAGWETYYLRLAHTYTFSRATLDALLRRAGWRPTARRPAAKGDQWVLSERGEAVAEAAPPPGHADTVRKLIASYRGVAGR